MTPLLEVENLVRSYRSRPVPWRTQVTEVLHGVCLAIPPGGALGLVGESGSGKSTLARTVLALDRPQSGTVRLEGRDLFALDRAGLRSARARMQAVFQDPASSLDPRWTVARIVAEPLRTGDRRAQAAAALHAVSLPASALDRRPHEFSGGQRQRIAIARAMVTRPALIVADEPVSALDVSVQAQILELIADLRAQGVGFLFISHDLAVVRIVCDHVAVLLRGHVVEHGPTETVLSHPRHPYTRALLAASRGESA